MTLSIIPTVEEIFQAARHQILAQHEGLRPHLRRALEIAQAAARDDPDAVDVLPSQIMLLLAELKSHMAYEESVLLPILAGNGALGPEQCEVLMREHAQQRDEFSALFELARGKTDPAGLARALQILVGAVLADMAQEEQRLAHERIVVAPPRWAVS